MTTKEFTHTSQPYGYVKFSAHLETREVPRYVPNEISTGTRKQLFAVGVVTESDWCGAFCGGVAVSTQPRDSRYPVGSKYETDVTQQEWDEGSKLDIAM